MALITDLALIFKLTKSQILTWNQLNVKESYPLSDSVRSEELSEPTKNSKGIGRGTYIITVRENELSSSWLISILDTINNK